MSKDSLRILRLSGDYALQDALAGDNRPAVNTAELRVSKGLPILGASTKGQFDAAREHENPDFIKASGEFSRSQTLFQPWSDSSVALFGLLAWQGTGDILPPSEKFFLGGLRLNRGYYSGQVTGDNGVSTSVELQLSIGTAFSVFGLPITAAPQLYGFYDWGYAWQNQRFDPNGRLESAGGGVRLPITRYFEIDVEGVSRLTLNPYSSTLQGGKLGPDAVYWRALARF